MLRYGIVVNQNSGSVTDNMREDFVATLEASKLDYHIEFVEGDAMLVAAQKLLKQGCTALVAGGGDGSLGQIAGFAASKGIPFAALPFGTLNHFAKDIGLPSDHAALIQILEVEKTKQIDFATAGDKVFLNNSSIGIYPELVFRREDREQRIGKWPAAALSLIDIIRKPLNCVSLTITHDGDELTVKTPFVFIGNNDYGFDSFGVNKRDKLDAGSLSLCIFRGQSRPLLIWHLLRSAFGRPSKGVLDCYSAKNIVIVSAQEILDITFDGEITQQQSPIHYSIHKKALTIIAP
ncbi:MAG: diacylglycerol kinase family protein [Candidatus Saccharibacteria bacterium]